ncbi:MAG: hypothetical protein WA162_01750 [Thermodesulfobacteriota bacterium]
MGLRLACNPSHHHDLTMIFLPASRGRKNLLHESSPSPHLETITPRAGFGAVYGELKKQFLSGPHPDDHLPFNRTRFLKRPGNCWSLSKWVKVRAR